MFGMSRVEQTPSCEGRESETDVGTQAEHVRAADESTAIEPSDRVMGAAEAYLELVGGEGKLIPIKGETMTIGTGEGCDLRIDEGYPHHESVSELHAQIERWRDMWLIKDLTGKGVFINGRRTGENALYDGYRIRLGELEFVFREALIQPRRTD